MGVFRLEAPGLSEFLPAQFGRGGDIGGDLLTERLDALAVEGVLPSLGRLLQLARAQPPPLRVQPESAA